MSLEKNLFESIDQLIDAKLNQISFDKTITATVIDDSNADKNQYYVQSGNDKFYAYANGGVYTNGSQVYVTIPQGDYSMKKLIIGAYDSDKFDEEVLTSPLKRMVNISGNLLSADPTISIPGENTAATGEINTTTIGSAFTYDPTKFDVGVPVKYLGFSATITTSGISEAVRGNYGFAIVKSKEDDGYEWSDFLYIFDCTQFLGNPYNYFSPGFKQEIVFDASVIDKATELKLIFYHRDNFYKADGTAISSPEFELNNLLLCYGPSAEDYKTSKDRKELILWSEVNGYTIKDAISSQIDIRAKWIHEDPDEPGTYITKENVTIEGNGITLTLYRYMPGIEDLGAGPHWAKAVEKTDIKDFVQMEGGAVGPVTPLHLQIGDYYTFPYTNNGTSAWQTKLETTGKAYTTIDGQPKVDWTEGTGVDLILVPFKDAVNSREDFKAVLEKITNHSDVKCMIMGNVTVSLSLGQENIVPGTIELTSAEMGGSTTEVVFNEKNKTIQFGDNTEQSIIINYEKGTIKLANGGKFVATEDVEYELYFNFNSSIKITSNTLSFAKVEEGGDIQTPGDRNAELTFFYHKDAKYKGVYQVYGYDQEILDNQLGYKDEEIWVQFADGTSKFQAGDVVKFWIPKNATMLLPPTDTTWNSLAWSESKETDNNWYVYEHTVSADSAEKPSLKLHYRVKSHYSINANNNTIKCTVSNTKKESKDNTEINVQQTIISGTKDLEFRMLGSSGTDYTLVIDMYKCFKQNTTINGTTYLANEVYDNLPALGIYCSGTNSDNMEGTATNQTDKNIFNHFIDVVLKAKLYDPNGYEIPLTNTSITWSLASTIASDFMKFNSNWRSESVNQYAKLSTETRKLDFGHPAIIKASIPWTGASGRSIALEAFISVPIIRFPTTDNWVIPANIDELISTPMQGPTRVIYNNQGQIPIYLDEPLEFKYKENTTDTSYRVCNPTPSPLIFGHIIKETTKNKEGNSIIRYKYKPPETLTVKDIQNNVAYSGNFVSDTILMKNSSSNVVWAQRVILERNPYSLSRLRDWSGNLTIDSNENRILANSIAAGKMENKNAFTGVIMGEIGKFDDTVNNQFGLFGYNAGINRFRLSADGTFCVEGKDGRMELDENGDFSISAKKFTLSADNLYLGSEPNINRNLMELGKEGKRLTVSEDGTLDIVGITADSIIIQNTAGDILFKADGTAADENKVQIAGWSVGTFSDTGGGAYTNSIYSTATKKNSENQETEKYRIFMRSSNASEDCAIGILKANFEDNTIKNWTYNFKLLNNGYLEANEAKITGTIEAIDGKIGNWNLGTFTDYNEYNKTDPYPNALYSNTSTSGSGYRVFLCARPNPSSSNVFFGIKKYTNINSNGTSTPDYGSTGDSYGYVFNITYDGCISTSNIVATGGKIGGWTISSNSLKTANEECYIDSTGEITIETVTALTSITTPYLSTSNLYLKHNGYVIFGTSQQDQRFSTVDLLSLIINNGGTVVNAYTGTISTGTGQRWQVTNGLIMGLSN